LALPLPLGLVDGVVLQHQKPSEVIQYNASRLSYRLSADLEAIFDTQRLHRVREESHFPSSASLTPSFPQATAFSVAQDC
jgi:hypothetical protein